MPACLSTVSNGDVRQMFRVGASHIRGFKNQTGAVCSFPLRTLEMPSGLGGSAPGGGCSVLGKGLGSESRGTFWGIRELRICQKSQLTRPAIAVRRHSLHCHSFLLRTAVAGPSGAAATKVRASPAHSEEYPELEKWDVPELCHTSLCQRSEISWKRQ